MALALQRLACTRRSERRSYRGIFMKLRSVFVGSLVVAGLSFGSASAHAAPLLDVGICLDRDGSCATATSCNSTADCSLSILNLGKVCDTVAHKCVTSCVGDLVSGVLGTNTCQDGTAPVCGVGGTGLCGCNSDTQCGTGKTCSPVLHRCVAPVSLPDAGAVTIPTLPNLPVVDAGGPDVPTIPSAPGSSSGGTSPDGTSSDGSSGGGSSSGNGATSGSASVAAGASAGAQLGDAGLDADVAVAADGGCSTGGHGSGVTFLGVLGAAFAFAAARRRRQH